MKILLQIILTQADNQRTTVQLPKLDNTIGHRGAYTTVANLEDTDDIITDLNVYSV